MRKLYIAMAILIVVASIAIAGTGSAKDSAVVRLVSNPNPKPGEIVTVTILPLGLSSYYAVEEHIGSLMYTGEHTADSNPSGTIFLMLTPKSFSYNVKMPMFIQLPGLEMSITGEYWTQPRLKYNIGKTVLGRGPTVYIVPAFQEVGPQEVFNVDIRVNPAGKGVSAVQVTMRFDAGAMSVDGVELGDLLGTSPILAPGYPKIDNAGGTVQIAAARTGATTPPTAEGVFAKITVTAGNEFAAQGTHLFTLEKAQVVDENSLDISGVASANGAVALAIAREILPEGVAEPGPGEDGESETLPDGGEEPGPGEGGESETLPDGGGEPEPGEGGECEIPRWDINEDGTVNTLDLIQLATDYEQSQITYPRSDINEDGFRELKDHSLLCAHWDEWLDCGDTESTGTSTPIPGQIVVPSIPGLPLDRSGQLWPDWTGSLHYIAPLPQIGAAGSPSGLLPGPPPPPTKEPSV